MILISRDLDNKKNVEMEMEFAHEQLMPAAAACRPNDRDVMFEELNDFYMEQQQQVQFPEEGDQELPGGEGREQHWIDGSQCRATELLLYMQDPSVQLYKVEHSSFSCPLTWCQTTRV